MNIELSDLERTELNKLCDTALRALPTMIKLQTNQLTKVEMRAHRDAIMQIKLKIKD